MNLKFSVLVSFDLTYLLKIEKSRNMSDCLVEISPKDLPTLKNLYKNDASNNILATLTIENYIRWFEQDPAVEYVKFFCLNGDFSDGSFVVLASVHFSFIKHVNKI